MSTVAIIDYGMGNLHSISKALQHVAPDNTQIIVTDNHQKILAADRVVFPGVGAIGDCMRVLNETGLAEVIKEIALDKKPLLGICLGMQALLTTSAESNGRRGLNLFAAHASHFPTKRKDIDGNALKVPHMGWNQVKQIAHPLWKNIPDNSRFYFVHSYYVIPFLDGIDAGMTDYLGKFSSALARDNIFAVQFHPEKSQTVGLQLLKNFLDWNGKK